jgi:hypothetical protein
MNKRQNSLFPVVFGLFRQTATEWLADKAPQLGAALAYYYLFRQIHFDLRENARPQGMIGILQGSLHGRVSRNRIYHRISRGQLALECRPVMASVPTRTSKPVESFESFWWGNAKSA